MKFLNLPLTFVGVILLGRCLPTTYCAIYYGLQWMQKRARIVNPAEKFTDAVGIEPLTPR
jgi:hypothetical protein